MYLNCNSSDALSECKYFNNVKPSLIKLISNGFNKSAIHGFSATKSGNRSSK